MFKQLPHHASVTKSVRHILLFGLTFSMLPSQSFAANETTVEEKKIERIVVTGSRLQKAAFDQAVPVQVLVIDDAIKAGISSVAQLLQRTSMAGGQQFDSTYNSSAGNSNFAEAPPSGGVGSSNIGLRGLDPERTLILVNGRRIGSSGVRGAPSQPDLSLLPLNMVDRIEIITEGASSIYGADAVAGVINVIMKRGYQGAEISANVTKTKEGGGAIRQFSFVTGHQGNKSNLVLSAAYYDQKAISVGQRADGCVRTMARSEDGTIYTECDFFSADNFALNFVDGFTGPNGGDFFTFYTPGATNIGVPNFSTGAGLPEPPYDTVRIDGNGRNRYRYNDNYTVQGDMLRSDLVQPATRFSLSLNGTYQIDLLGGDEELFYEAYYFHRHLTSHAITEQSIPTISGLIPHEDADGNLVRDADGALDLVDNPMNPFSSDATVIVTLDDLPQIRDVELDHVRFLVGLRGDFPAKTMAAKGWNYEMHASYDRGMGHQSQQVLHEGNLFLSNETLRLDVNGNPICGLNKQSSDLGGFLTLKDCVVTDWFAPSIFSFDQNNSGTFGSDAEREYLVATRTNRTVVEQVLLNAYATGELFDFDMGGTVIAAFGAEYRKDDIWSAVDYLGATGGNAAVNPLSEGATIGGRKVNSTFAEISLPIFVGKLGIELLEIEAAVRFTDESNFGNKTTSRARMTYKPVDSVILSASYGTSFRAPNLREQFLADQLQGVSGYSDPCMVPQDANIGGVYDPAADNRPQVVHDNCIQNGADPTALGLIGVISIPVTVGGNSEQLLPETSTNYTYSLKWNPDWDTDYKVNFALTFFDIEIENTIRSIDGAIIMARCYNDAPNLSSPFCARINRNTDNIPEVNVVTGIDASFLNVGLETSKGFDINFDYSIIFTNVFSETLTMEWSNQYTQMTEREVTIFTDEAPEDLLADFGNAKHRLVSTVNFGLGNFDLLFVGRYLSGTHADDTTSTTRLCDRFIESTDLVLPDGSRPNVQPICQAGGAFYLDTSLTWKQDNFRVTAGINNVLDKKTPRVSWDAGSNRANMVTSSGYDLFGQTLFLNSTYAF
jgi:iron complex outermembrane receptor protein